GITVALVAWRGDAGESWPEGAPEILLTENMEVAWPVTAKEKARVREYIRRARPGAPGELRIDNPRDGSVFPPEFTPPTLVWRNEGKVARTWLIEFDVGDSVNVAVLRPSLGPPVPALD